MLACSRHKKNPRETKQLEDIVISPKTCILSLQRHLSCLIFRQIYHGVGALPSSTEMMVAMRTQFLFSMPFTSLPLRSFLANISMLIVQKQGTKANNQLQRYLPPLCSSNVSVKIMHGDEERGRFIQTQPEQLYKGCCCHFQQGGGGRQEQRA